MLIHVTAYTDTTGVQHGAPRRYCIYSCISTHDSVTVNPPFLCKNCTAHITRNTRPSADLRVRPGGRWAASALVRRMHTTSEKATSDKNYATYPRPHRAPAARPRERPGATAHKGHKRPREEATLALPNVLRRRPARLPWVGGVHMRALAARLCASRSRAGRPATARTPRRSAGMWTSTRPPRRSPPVAAATRRGWALERGEGGEERGEARGAWAEGSCLQDGALLGKLALQLRILLVDLEAGGGARWERAAAGALWRGGEGSRGQPNGGPKGGSRRNGGERASRLLQRAPHRLHVSPPGWLGRLAQHQRRLLWSGDQAAEREGGGGRLSNRDGADERAPPPSRARVRTSANRREAAAARP